MKPIASRSEASELLTGEWDQLVADLHGTHTGRAVAAVEALARDADESRLPQLHQLLAGGRNFFIREAAATPIARMEGLHALPQLLTAMQQGEDEGHDNDGLSALISDLIAAEPEKSAPILFQMSRDPAERVRCDAAWLMGYAAGAITPEPLLEALLDPSPRVRAEAAGALSSFKGRPEALDGLIRAVRDDEEEVRVSAASALSYFGDPRAEPALREATADAAERVRTVARYALRQLKDQAAR